MAYIAVDPSASDSRQPPAPGARGALALLLGINLFNYIDRYVLAAVEPAIRETFFGADNEFAKGKTGLLATAFLVSYMVAAPVFGWLADRMSRWILVGASVILWSLATGASGWAGTFTILLLTRVFVGLGEAGYGPAAPTLISDYYPVARRGSVLAWFYMAVPVGSALGYAFGGFIASHWGWRQAFYAVVLPGLALGVIAFLMREPARGLTDTGGTKRKASLREYLLLFKNRSYMFDTAGMTALTFAIGGISYWMPAYLVDRGAGDLAAVNMRFGAILVVAGLIATLAGGWAGDKLRGRVPGAYFVVSAVGIWIACPLIALIVWTPFPYAWGLIFLAVFFLFFNTGPSNTILANVTHPAIRATAFAVNIFIIHALGDALSPPLLGGIADRFGWSVSFLTVAGVTAVAGLFWILGAKHLEHDTASAPRQLDPIDLTGSSAR